MPAGQPEDHEGGRLMKPADLPRGPERMGKARLIGDRAPAHGPQTLVQDRRLQALRADIDAENEQSDPRSRHAMDEPARRSCFSPIQAAEPARAWLAPLGEPLV